MNANTACTGECMYEDFRLKFQIINLEYIKGKLLKIEAVCINTFNEVEREAIFKYSTSNLNSTDERLKISNSIINSLIKRINVNKDKLYKLIVKNKKIYFISIT